MFMYWHRLEHPPQMFMYWHRLEHPPSNLLNRAFSEYKNNIIKIATLGIPIYSFIVKK